MRLLAIFGTRPELIKLAPVVRALRATSDGLDLRICATAQHRDLVDPLLRLFDITPDIDLDVMRPDQSLSDVIRDVIGGLAPIIGRDRPDWVMVQGDTSSTLAAGSFSLSPANHTLPHPVSNCPVFSRAGRVGTEAAFFCSGVGPEILPVVTSSTF